MAVTEELSVATVQCQVPPDYEHSVHVLISGTMEGKPLKPYTGQDSKLGLSFGGGKVTGYKRHHHRKRSFPFPKNNPAKIRRTSQSMSLKAPLVALNEKYGKVEFDIKPKGEGFDAGFEARFLHNGQEYVGYGISKKSAKTEAAKKCLQFNEIPYLEIPDKGEILSAGGEKPASPIVRESEPFSYFPEGYTDFSEDAATAEIPQLTKPIENKEVDLQRAVESPSMVLNELIPGLSKRLEWVETKSKTKFCCRINLRGHTFEGTGLGKKAARKKLANNVLSKFFGIRFPTKGKSISGEDKKASVLGKMHAYARVKHIDPSSKYEFENISDGDKLLYKAKLFMCGKEYECVHSEREKAKFQVAKLGLKDNEDTEKSNLTIVERIIDTSKHPFQMFHEYYGSPELMEQELTDKKIPYFLQGVMIDGQYIVAEASSKKRAKVKLALKVFERNHGINIDAWNSLKDDIKAEYLAEKDNPDPQIALSNLTDVDVLTDIDEISNQQVYPPRGVPMVLPTGNQGQCEKNSVSILNELHPGVDFVYTEENFGNNRIQYKCVVTVGEKTFDGDGYSKKAAKLVAASKALEVIYGIDASTNEIGMKTSHNNFDISVEFADKVLDAINAKFSSVFQSDTPYKVIASVVMTKEVGGAMIDAFEILSIATGTKCISGESINCSGQVLNDCHAEVIAGRGLRQFFFDQLHLAASDKESCFQRVPDSQLFQMKPDLHLFLYINTAPCGDGRVYSVEVSSNNKTVGILRTKVENGQGKLKVFICAKVILSTKLLIKRHDHQKYTCSKNPHC